MTEDRFFRSATLLPLVVPALAGLAVVVLKPMEALPGVFTVRDYAGTIAVAGLYSAIPYLVFLVILFTLIRPASSEKWHHTLALAPLVIAVVIGAVIAISGIVRGGPSVEAGAMFWGLLTLITGYAYAGAIWLARQLFRWAGWIRSD